MVADAMQMAARKAPDRRKKSCTECRRRRQKCIPGTDPDGPCRICAKRYPPVACIKSGLDARLKSNRRPGNVQVHVLESIDHDHKESPYHCPLETPKQFGGTIVDINTANIVPLDPTPQNAELLCFYLQQLSPRMASLDGQNTPSIHRDAVLPLLMQSPLLPKIGILEAARFRQLFYKPDVAETRRVIALKGEILMHVNSYVEEFDKAYREAIQSVIHLVLLEYYWGNYNSLMIHMNGLKGMIRLRGGIHALHNPLVAQLVILLDFEIACCFEQGLRIVEPKALSSISATQCPESFESPLCSSGASFPDVLKNFTLSTSLTTILHDLRLLTSSIANIFNSDSDSEVPTYQKQSTVIFSKTIHIQKSALSLAPIPISTLSPPSHLISEILRITLIVYTTALASRLPISSVYPKDLRLQVYTTIFKVSLSDWKKIPGVYLWVLLVASPGSGKDSLGKLVRTNETLAAMYVGLNNFEFLIDCLRTFLCVQCWIVSGKGKERNKVQSSVSASSLRRLPAPSTYKLDASPESNVEVVYPLRSIQK